MVFKMSQEFPTTSLDITEDFHILCSAYINICYSILKAKTYNWLPNTHTHTHTHTWPATTTNKKQLSTSHRLLRVIWLAPTLVACTKFWPLWVIKTTTFCWHRTGCGDTCRLWSNEGIFLVLASVQQTAQNPTPWQDWGLSELHIPHAQYTPPAFLLPLPVSGHLSRGFSVPPTKRAYSALHPQAFSECSPLDFQRSSVVGVGESHSWACSLQLHLHWPNFPSGQFPPRWWWKRQWQ